jgi:ABC-type transport system substrate-binding protein
MTRKRPPKETRLDRLTRRQMIAATGVGIGAAMAGCPGDSDDGTTDEPTEMTTDDPLPGDTVTATEGMGPATDTDTATPTPMHVEGQDLVLTTGQLPTDVHFAPPYFGSSFEKLEDNTLTFGSSMRPVFMGAPAWSRMSAAAYGNGELYPGFLESVEYTQQKITLTIKEDANWSDGEPIRAFDAAGTFRMMRPSEVNSEQFIEEENIPEDKTLDDIIFQDARDPVENDQSFPIQEVTMPDGRDGKVVELHNWDWDEYPAWEDVGGFDQMNWSDFYNGWLSPTRRVGFLYPSHAEPWKTLVEDRWDWSQEHKLVGPDPMSIYDSEWGSNRDYIAAYITVDDLEATREEGGIPMMGAFALEEVRGAQEVVFKKNEHHHRADQINFDRVRYEFTTEPQRLKAGVRAGRLDYSDVSTPPETVKSYPDKYEVVNSPALFGHVINVDHSSKFGNRLVRQAIMYALDKEAIASNINPTATKPVKTIGECWASDAVVDDEWMEETLIDYSQDLDKAAEKMEEAGYEKSGGVWEKDGESLTAQIATDAKVPFMETTVVSQLNSFGVEAELMSFDGSTFTERWEGSEAGEMLETREEAVGDFDIWSAAMGRNLAGQYIGQAKYWYETVNTGARARAAAFYDHDATEAGIFNEEAGGFDGSYAGGGTGYSWSCAPGCQLNWTVDVPPIGEPDGRPEPFQATAVTNTVSFDPYTHADPINQREGITTYHPPHPEESHPENREFFFKQYMWLNNWFVPSIPVALKGRQHFLNTANWNYPTDSPMWQYFGMGWSVGEVAGQGLLSANEDNPKEGATVVEK